MGSLNDDVEEGLNNDVDPTGLIQAPVDNNQPKEEITFVTSTNSNQTQPNTDSLNIIDQTPDAGQLPDINAQFEIVENDRVVLTDLKSVEATIINQQVISREDADVIDSVFGDFFGPRLSRQEFTAHQSKSNLPYAQRFMRQRIASEELELMSKFKVLFEEPLEDFTRFEHHYEHYYIPFIRDQILSLRATHEEVLKNIIESKNVVIPWGPEQKTFINLMTLPTTTELIENNGIDIKLEEALNSIRFILTNATFVGFMQAVISKGISVSEWTQLASHNDYYENTFVIGDLITFYNSAFLLESLDQLLLSIRATLVLFNNLVNSSKSVEQNFDKIDEFLACKVPEIKALNDRFQTLFEVAKNLALLNVSMHSLLTYLKRCL